MFSILYELFFPLSVRLGVWNSRLPSVFLMTLEPNTIKSVSARIKFGGVFHTFKFLLTNSTVYMYIIDDVFSAVEKELLAKVSRLEQECKVIPFLYTVYLHTFMVYVTNCMLLTEFFKGLGLEFTLNTASLPGTVSSVTECISCYKRIGCCYH